MINHHSNTLKIGLLGESEGNGHPFSWSAIFNGYNPSKMIHCGFATIPEYLARQEWDKPHITNSKITHIWTPNIERSKIIASTCKNIEAVNSISDLEGRVDAYIIARDDYVHNLDLAKILSKQAKPILFDKQISMTHKQTLEIIEHCKINNAAIFTGSAIAKDHGLPLSDWIANPEIKNITAITPKKWENYAIHVIDPLITAINDCNLAFVDSVSATSRSNTTTSATIKVKRNNMQSCLLNIIADLNHKGGFSFIAEGGAEGKAKYYEITDPFNCFKQYLIEFVSFCRLFQDPQKIDKAKQEQNSIIAHHLRLQAIIDKAIP